MRPTIGDRTGVYKRGLLTWKENPRRIHTAVLVCRKQTKEQKPFRNKNSIYETKTISGDLIRETKTDHNKKTKRLDVEVLARRVHVHISTKRTVQATQGLYATYSK